jgi:gamma-glutamylcyclotransferase (GGCT)/AIG2-like uncharacterized protein YtfP
MGGSWRRSGRAHRVGAQQPSCTADGCRRQHHRDHPDGSGTGAASARVSRQPHPTTALGNLSTLATIAADVRDEVARNDRFAMAEDMDAALCRLATYGSLAPGRPNHHQLNGLDGRWVDGHVYGTLVDAGWGAGLGYPALILDPDGSPIDVQIFESVDLPDHWSRLDEFEGPGYQRVVATVRTASGDVDASIYVIRPD